MYHLQKVLTSMTHVHRGICFEYVNQQSNQWLSWKHASALKHFQRLVTDLGEALLWNFSMNAVDFFLKYLLMFKNLFVVVFLKIVWKKSIKCKSYLHFTGRWKVGNAIAIEQFGSARKYFTWTFLQGVLNESQFWYTFNSDKHHKMAIVFTVPVNRLLNWFWIIRRSKLKVTFVQC